MLAKLNSLGIYCQTWVTAERQERAKRWVLRGVESGGSARELGTATCVHNYVVGMIPAPLPRHGNPTLRSNS